MNNKNKNINKSFIQFTVFADLHKKTAKSYDLSENGELIKGPMGNFYEGAFQTEEIPYSELSEYIESMEPGFFLVQGVHQSLYEGICPKDATRTKVAFPFSENPGLLCIDTDSVHKMGINSVEELNDALNKIEPNLENVMKVMSPSASSHISVDGIEENGLRGIHTFIPIDKTINNKVILEALHVRSVLAGYAYPKITKAGTIKINSLIDKALCTSNQPIFEGGAIPKNKAITQNRVIQSFEGEILHADLIPALTEQEIADYNNICKKLEAEVKKEAQEIRRQFKEKIGQKLIKNNNQLSDKAADEILNQAIFNSRLQPEFLIHLESGEEVTVQEILNNPIKYHEMPCAHPLDHEILGKTVIYSNQEKPVIHSFAHGGEIFFLGTDAEEAVVDWRKQYKGFVLHFNETHAQVLVDGKHKIMRTIPSHLNFGSRTYYEFISQEDLRKMYANEKIQVNEKINGELIIPIYKDKITAWVSHGDSRKYKNGVLFAPAKHLSDDCYNLWQGFDVEPVAGANIDVIKRHIELVVCKGNPELIKYFYDWTAYTFQNPDKPAGSALVLRGEKGCGKGTIGHFLRKIWGQHGVHISNSKHLVGNFNAHLADACFLFADEAFYSGDRQHEGVLKALITEPTFMNEKKFKDVVSKQNFLKIFMVTNNEYAVPASRDERRYCVFDVSSDRIGDKKYFEELHAACDVETVQCAFLYEMLNRDIKDFHSGNIPESQGLKDQRLASLNSAGKWLADSFTQGYFNLKDENNNPWQNEMTSENLYSSYITWCDSQRITYRMSQNSLCRYLTKIFGQGKKLKNDKRGYIFGSLSEAISKIEKYEKIDLGLMTENLPLDFDKFESTNEEYENTEFNFGMISEQFKKPINFKYN